MKKSLRTVLFCLILLVFLSGSAAAAGPDTWNWRHPLPAGNDLDPVAIGNGRIVAAGGDNGTILTTKNGRSWHQYDIVPKDQYFMVRNVRFLNGEFFLTGRIRVDGRTTEALYISSDGLSWTQAESPAFDRAFINDLAWGNGLYVGAGERQDPNQLITTFVSTDGRSWERVEMSEVGFLHGVAYGNGIFIAHSPNGLLLSSDGRTWTEGDAVEADRLRSIGFINGHFALIGDTFALEGSQSALFFSDDGTNWEEKVSVEDRQLMEMAYGGGRYVAVGFQGTVVHSTNGVSWQESQRRKDEIDFAAIVSRNSKFLAVGIAGRIAWTGDGANWEELSQGFYQVALRDTVAGGGRFVVSGGVPYNRSLTAFSPDGRKWEGRIQSEYVGPSLGYGAGLFVALGPNGAIHTSPDGLSWTRRESGTKTYLRSVHYHNGLFVAVGYESHTPATGTIVVSVDGMAWMPVIRNAAAHFRSVTWGDGRWVIAGNTENLTGLIYLSSDGRNWTRRELPEDPDRPSGWHFEDVIYGKGRFVALGDYGDIFQSADGWNWARTAQLRSSGGSLSYGKGVFAAATHSAGLPGIYTSTDGVSWMRRDTRAMYSITFHDDTFLAVSERNILQSDLF